MMVLKKAYGPAALAALSVVPTYMFGEITKERFLRSYQDAGEQIFFPGFIIIHRVCTNFLLPPYKGLLQTSQLDGWDLTQSTSVEDREEYRKWLVDCHKASFVPICLAGVDNFLTAEPAVVVPTERDAESLSLDVESPPRRRLATMDSMASLQSNQRGAMFRRVSGSPSPSRSSLDFYLYSSKGSQVTADSGTRNFSGGMG